MDRFENGVNGGLGLFIEDREIHFEPRRGVGSILAGGSESLIVPTPGTVLG
jgi:hypothetical protein